jgi:hypothetical protein
VSPILILHVSHALPIQACRFGIVSFWSASECPRERGCDETPGLDPVEISAS